MSSSLKYLLTRIGTVVSERTIYNLNASVNYLEVGRWMGANGYSVGRRLARREQLFDMVAAEVAHCEVLYMEFGVFRDAATRYWSKLLLNPNSRLDGFDSFEGMPADWLPQCPEGHFSVDGKLPQIGDPRVCFFKGWFEETLPHYQFAAREVLVLNFEADLYSSTSFVLKTLERAIVPGTYLYFDEFNHQFHELRAFDEFTKRTAMKFRLLGATRTLEHVLFQRTA